MRERTMLDLSGRRLPRPARGVPHPRRSYVPPSCPHCDPPDLSLLRLVLIGEILRAEEPLLVRLADLLQTCGLLPLAAAAPAASSGPGRQALRLVAAPDPGRGSGSAPPRTAPARPPRRRG